jgi:hypothetical protein
MDSNYQEIPIVEDDMGEGVHDIINPLENKSDKRERDASILFEKLKRQEYALLQKLHSRK